MRLKELQEKRVSLIAVMEEVIEVREGQEVDTNKFDELKAEIEKVDAEIRQLDLEAIKEIKTNKREMKGNDNMEIREMLVNGQEVEVRNGEISNANIGVERTEFLPGIVDKVAEISPLFDRANKINTSSTSAITVQGTKLPKFVKTAELAEYTKAQATFEEKVLKAEKYALAVVVSEECLEDAGFDLEGQIETQLVEGLGETLNELAVQKLEGAEGAKKVEVALTADGLMDMYYALPVGYRAGAVFVISPDMEREIAKLKDTNGQPLMIRSFTDRPVYTILGCEVIVDKNVTKPMFVNLGKALVAGLRRVMNIKRNDSIGFLSGSVAFRADIRLDMVTTIEEAIVIGSVAGRARASK
ncbi:phage major capsid protein [Clostridium saudiense]|jgi:HK97 family phage major capsid protein|uniref:phage major capsid protein n=1 Tax=Clostridium saudiense TaxID=1414720 RepID=UPI0026721F84|nr:phage major capsid protein [Clostridium saudiense]